MTTNIQTFIDNLLLLQEVESISVTDNGLYCVTISLKLAIDECEPVRLMTYEPKVLASLSLRPKVVDTWDCRAAYDAVRDALRAQAASLRVSYRIIAAPVIERTYTQINPTPHTVLEPNGSGLIELCDNGEYFKNI